MQTVMPRIGRQNVVIEYRDNMGGGRLGYSGRSHGPVPLVTVSLRDMQYQFIMLGVIRGLLGAACTTLKTTPNATVEAMFPCVSITPFGSPVVPEV